ncbi:hypothetical protein HAPAU_28570 [Halalkalicoccus paucihalophilus]|uniref:Uncharacterized protein n=1 Tax=Halalkalicoccus paucihalophilus TaxID=1008153 RepID=A0A151ABF9_9EURY|nr:hypothetical protein [Halalkalicoccus paucihalophilus]KYH25036.1 hypothetical protein HAPAU_28570 [Halalkalicoccus paucihalophilus]
MTPTLGTSRRRLAVLLLVCVAVALAGCSGWGANGPADEPDASNASSDDLEDEQNDDSSNTTDGSDATNGSDSTANGEESDDGPPDDGSASVDDDSADDPNGTDESGGADTSDGSDDGSEESTDENTENESDGTDDESPSEQPPADENADENDGDEDTTDENGSDDPETYTLTVEAEGPVTIERLSDGATTTREATDGTVEFTVLEGDYDIRAGAEEYVDPMQSFGVTEDRTVTLQRGGSITYTVVDAETGEPIEGAEISGLCDLWYSSGDASISGQSNASGVIEAETLIPTTCRYDTQITAEGYEPASLGEINVPEDDGTTVELQPEGSNATLALGVTSIARA